jgi:molecular chaperone HtpG
MVAAPYRGGPEVRASTAREETGLVADLIEQFADPLAFYRELVQNAIDAGTESITVRIAWNEGAAHVSVRDAGKGMSREVIEEELLVLFRSGKEDRDDAIGKFGVGFVSVLAMAPELVEVRTATGSGIGHVVHLRSDQSWNLFETQGSTMSGTTVTLHVPVASEAYGQLVVDSENALARWCKHARVPIHFVALDQKGEIIREARIDRPLELEDALVSVTVESGETRAVVGKLAGRVYGGFFNGGLTLWETDAPMVGSVSFKVQDPHLEHTLSRDNVRRDPAFERALRVVRGAVQNELPRVLIDALAEAADSDLKRYRTLLSVVDEDTLRVPSARWTFPIMEKVAGRQVATGDDPLSVYSTRHSPLVRALAEQGIRVLDARGLDRSQVEALLGLVSRVTGHRSFREAHARYTLMDAVEPTPLDEVLLSTVADILEDVARAPSAIHLAALSGAGSKRLCIGAELPRLPWLVTQIDDDPLRLLARPPLVLNAHAPLVNAAREAMSAEPEIAATFVARGVLLATGRLDAKCDEALTRGAVERLLGSAP